MKELDTKVLLSLALIASLLVNVYFLYNQNAKTREYNVKETQDLKQKFYLKSGYKYYINCINDKCTEKTEPITKEDVQKMEEEFARRQKAILKEIQEMQKMHEQLMQNIFSEFGY